MTIGTQRIRTAMCQLVYGHLPSMERFGMDANEMLVVVTLSRQLTVQIDYLWILDP